ncbi:MAG: LysR family transcriptional regulator [Alphaproteobacteria bacterium]|nr:LysR family transcriptional regulator [Alphaproteobacteria bacterium]
MLDRLTLDQLRTLIAVAETGSFSAAGRSLRRVQSAVSQTIQALETTLDLALFDRTRKSPVLTEAGKALLADARRLITGADALRARAESIASDVEPELTLAVESMFPNRLLMQSLRVLTAAFPDLPVRLFTETLGGAEQRLREGAARLAFYSPRPTAEDDFATEFLAAIDMVPVVAASHPLAQAKAPIERTVLEDQVQLVLTDRTQITARFSAGVISRRIWRFADLNTRLDYLLGGFGWCNMPLHLVAAPIAAGQLKRLQLAENDRWSFPIHVVHPRSRPPGRAGRMLIADLRGRLADCAVGAERASLATPADSARPGRARTRRRVAPRSCTAKAKGAGG